MPNNRFLTIAENSLEMKVEDMINKQVLHGEPEDTWQYVVENIERHGYETLTMSKIWKTSEMHKFIAENILQLDQYIPQNLEDKGLSLEDILSKDSMPFHNLGVYALYSIVYDLSIRAGYDPGEAINE